MSNTDGTSRKTRALKKGEHCIGVLLEYEMCRLCRLFVVVVNIVVVSKSTGAVQACRLIDFQTMRYSMPTLDLMNLLLNCTEKAMRDQHWDGLLRGYHDQLLATLSAAGCQHPHSIYPWEKLQVRALADQ